MKNRYGAAAAAANEFSSRPVAAVSDSPVPLTLKRPDAAGASNEQAIATRNLQPGNGRTLHSR